MAAMQPVQQEIEAERAANLARARQQMGFAKAAAAIAQGIAPRVQDTYDNAANADAGYARGLGDVVQQAVNQQAASNDAFLTKMGTPSAGLEHPADVGGTAYGLEGYIPATTLQREGAAFGSAAQMLPGDVLSAGRQQAGATLANDPNVAKLQDELGKIASTQPELYSKLLNQYQSQALSHARLNLDAQKAQFEEWARTQSLRQGQQRINLDVSKAQFEEAHAKAVYGLDYAKFMAAQQKAEKAQRHGGLTANELNTLHGHASEYVQGLYQGVPGHVSYPNASNGLSNPRIDSWKQQPVTYQRAIKLLIQRYPALGATGAIHLANQWYKPGEGGRPLHSDPKMEAILSGGGVSGLAPAPGMGGGAGPGGMVPLGRGINFEVPKGLSPRAARTAERIVGLAREYLGVPYVWGGESPRGFDCSGLAQYIYAKVGVSIPRTTYEQWKVGMRIGRNQRLEPGDLVFFKGSDSIGGLPGHVGIYIGDGKFIEAPHTGADVRVSTLRGYPGYMGARRYQGA